MPLEVSVPIRMPAAAIQRITRRGATFEPMAELRKLMASLATPTTMPRMAKTAMMTTIAMKRGDMGNRIFTFVRCKVPKRMLQFRYGDVALL